MTTLTRIETPEEQELFVKRQELETVRNQLAEAELDFHTLKVELAAFEALYLHIVGRLLVRLDELQAKLAEERAAHQPTNDKLSDEAREARTQAQTTAEAFKDCQSASNLTSKPKPSDECRKLYIQAAKAMHPDLAISPEEKVRRHTFMVALNEAYEAGDIERIRTILHDWDSSPESVTGDGVGADLVRVIRQMAQLQARLRQIEVAKAPIIEDDLYKLWQKAISTTSDASQYLNAMAAAIRKEIAILERELREMEPNRRPNE